ncbi:hypothetical protein RRG08_042210 [Elysia crispata]|uniref:Uncharacterized protein n=1 Tax=Elysia crispata TaxID=231223 RepID=A0AAE1EEE2_9GAST|nr:hypothetical protein RRG08_042210 [Elysia crispata]
MQYCLVDRFDHPDPNREGNICFNQALFKRPQSEQRPLALAPLDAVLGRESVPSLLTGQGKPSTAVTDRDLNQVLCGQSNVSVVEQLNRRRPGRCKVQLMRITGQPRHQVPAERD